MAYRVETVHDRRTMRDFLHLPFDLYTRDPLWVPPLLSEMRRVLDKDRNPYFRNAERELFVCYRGEKPVARTVVVINRLHAWLYREQAATFGFFESADDAEAAGALFEEATGYCRTRGVTSLEGPFNPNHYSEIGVQTNNFGIPPSFFQPHNLEYYMRLLDQSGFRVSKIVRTHRNAHYRSSTTRRPQGVKPCGSGEYVVRPLRMNDLPAELERIREVFNDAFAGNWHFLPLSREEYTFSAKFLDLVTFPELVWIVEHRGAPVGVVECVLDINPLLRSLKGKAGPVSYVRFLSRRKKIRTLIIYAGGIKKAYRRTRVSLLLYDALRRLAERYDVLETTWVSPENTFAVRIAEALGMKPDKEFALFRKEWESTSGVTNSLPPHDNSVATLSGRYGMLARETTRGSTP